MKRPRAVLRIGLALLWFQAGGVALSADETVTWFPQVNELFRPLLADPTEVKVSGQYFRLHGLDVVDFSVGETWGIKRWTLNGAPDWKIQWNLGGVVTPRFLVSVNINQLEAINFFLNVPVEMRHGRFSGRGLLFHESSHLGDNFIERTGQSKITFSREGAQLILAFEPLRFIRIYGGGAYLLHTIPELGKTTLQAGLELRTPNWHLFRNHDCWWYLLQDYQVKEEVNWGVNKDIQAGVSFGFSNVRRRLRLFTNYFRGHSPFGQFFNQKEQRLGVGIGFDF
ncbi:MAG: DUF1207 domain-containing protein [Elusimicrobia bacterium]|nr:DUF1207 domain-containing protein [Elusimicrobiota bacterium]